MAPSASRRSPSSWTQREREGGPPHNLLRCPAESEVALADLDIRFCSTANRAFKETWQRFELSRRLSLVLPPLQHRARPSNETARANESISRKGGDKTVAQTNSKDTVVPKGIRPQVSQGSVEGWMIAGMLSESFTV